MDVYRNPGLISYGRFLFRYRNALFPAVMGLLIIIFPPEVTFGSPARDVVADLMGTAILLFGLALRGLVIGLDYIKRGGQDKKVYADKLVTGGIFAHSRNPLYVGNGLIFFGLIVISSNPWVYLLGIVLTVSAYMAIVAAEEDFLRREFGLEYEHYCANVNRWLPAPRGLLQTLRDSRFHWARVVVKDYNTVYIWILAALAMMVYERAIQPGYDLTPLSAALLAFVFGLLSAAYVAVRLLKKHRILTQRGWAVNR